jgi:etoposide-induced protein 2.4 (EI24)
MAGMLRDAPRYAARMSLFLDSFWRAVAYCLHPRVIALSFLPLLIMVALSLGLGYFYWDPAVEWVRATLESTDLLKSVWGWLQDAGAGNLKTVVAPLIVIFVVTPVIVLLSLVVVAMLMAPALARLVAERRFPQLERKHGGSLATSIAWSLGSMVLALIALVVSLPLWLVPPLILLLPPLIWGWLTYRVMAFDALAEHASGQERRELFRRHRIRLLGIGVLTGYLGAAPTLLWASGALFAAAFVILVPLAIWIYTLVFAFASLWFAHYCLAALHALRAEVSAAAPPRFPTPSDAPSAPLALTDDTEFPRP